jgi:hypothetical protein
VCPKRWESGSISGGEGEQNPLVLRVFSVAS